MEFAGFFCPEWEWFYLDFMLVIDLFAVSLVSPYQSVVIHCREMRI